MTATLSPAPSPNLRPAPAKKSQPSEADVVDCIYALQDKEYARAVGFGGLAYPAHSEKIVELIFEKGGTALPEVSSEVVDALKICAACMEIFEDPSIPSCIQIQGNWKARLSPTAAALQILSSAQNALRLKNIQSHGAKFVKVIGNGHKSACPACANDAGKRYAIQDVPQIPHLHCTCGPDIGCGCMVVADE